MPKVNAEKICILQILNSHSSDITTCGFDNQLHLATGSSDKKVVVYEWKIGAGFVLTPYSPIVVNKYGVTNIKFFPEEQELATASCDGCISLFNVEDGDLLRTLMHTNLASVRNISYISSQKFLVSAADNGSVCIWDLSSKKSLKKNLRLHDESISVVCVSKDSKLMLTGDSTGFVKIWSVNQICNSTDSSFNVQPSHSIPDCHDLGINQADFSPNIDLCDKGSEYKVISGGNDNLVKVWKLICNKRDENVIHCKCELLFSIVSHGSAVTDVKFNHLGNLAASTSLDKTTRLWTFEKYTYQCVKILKGHKRYVTTCSFSPDGTLLATGSNDRSLIVWDLTGARTVHSSLGNSLPCSSQLSNPLKVKNVATILQKIENLGNAINSCAFSNSNLLAAGGTDKLVRLWHRSSNRFVQLSLSPLQGHQYAVNQVDFSLCGMYLVSCSVDGTAIIWNLIEYSQLGTVHSVEGGFKCCKFSPNSLLLATGGDYETVCVWSVQDHLSLKLSLTGHTDAISCLSFTSNSKYLASGCQAGSLRLWCVSPCLTICLLCEENVHDLGLTSADFSQNAVPFCGKDDYLLATGGNDSLVKLWIVHVVDELTAILRPVHNLIGHGGEVTCVRFPPSSSSLVASAATDKTARIWNTTSGACMHVLDSKESFLTCCTFSFDSSLLATGTLDKSIILWDLRKLAHEFEDFTATALCGKLNDVLLTDNDIDEVRRFVSEKSTNDLLLMNIPHEYICPITHQLMVQPVICSDGYTYERSAIVSWFSSGKLSSPMSNQLLSTDALAQNADLQNKIVRFVRQIGK